MRFSDFEEILRKQQLLLEVSGGEGDPEAKSISCDSRKIEKGTFFFAKGLNFKHEYLLSAEEKGAVAYIAEKGISGEGCRLPRLTVSNIRLAMPLLAKAFYGDPTSRFPLTGITGTKGKTTAAYLLKGILDRAYEGKTGIVSTFEARSCGTPLPKSFTTPEALELYGLLARFAEDGVRAGVIEASSQGLEYNRVEYLDFFAGVYLNLSPDHISPTEHASFEEYKEAKKRLLTLCRNGFVNLDDPYAKEILEAATCRELYTFGRAPESDFRAEEITLFPDGTEFRLTGRFYPGEKIRIAMPGAFNVTNALAAIAVATVSGIGLDDIREGLAEVRIPGRMENRVLEGRTVIADYAHNGMSLSGLLDYADMFWKENRKIVLFGSIGDRALDRRKTLAEACRGRADTVILTADDPGTEDPETICREIASYLGETPYEIIPDRVEAIARAAELSQPGDVLLLAGKGADATQAVKGKAVPYMTDMAAAEQAFQSLKNSR